MSHVKPLNLTPSVLERRRISWSPSGHGNINEPTSTLALNSTDGIFVDIRALKGGESSTAVSTESSMSEKLEWAFAGKVFVRHEDDTIDKDRKAHASWKHRIDSNVDFLPSHEWNTDPKNSDEGDLFLLPGGNILETGSMVNPSTGQMEDYEEHWLPMKVAKDQEVSIVSNVHDDATETRGVIARIGPRCQGLLHRVKAGVKVAERWHQSVDGKWKRELKFGNPDVHLPCEWTCAVKEYGETTEMDGLKWEVCEAKRGSTFNK